MPPAAYHPIHTHALQLETGCPFCDQFIFKSAHSIWMSISHERDSDLLFNGNHHVVVAGLGALTQFYCLVLPKRHIFSMGSQTEEETNEMFKILEKLTIYGKANNLQLALFEHGMSCKNRPVGGCIDHAHLHVAACLKPLCSSSIFQTQNFIQYSSIRDALSAGALGGDYLFCADTNGVINLAVNPVAVESQFFRKIIAEQAGHNDKWDWALYHGADNVCKTIRHAKKIFAQ